MADQTNRYEAVKGNFLFFQSGSLSFSLDISMKFLKYLEKYCAIDVGLSIGIGSIDIISDYFVCAASIMLA